jgi:hypothetical protein
MALDRDTRGNHDKVLAVFQLDAPISDTPRPQFGMEVSRAGGRTVTRSRDAWGIDPLGGTKNSWTK